MKRMEKHVNRVLKEMQSPQEEREEIKEELLSHLEEAKSFYMDQGDPEKKAEKKAVEEFGGSKQIGHGFQEAMYPYQRSLLYVIGLATILFGVIFHLYLTFTFGGAEPVWLLIQFLFGSLVVLTGMNIAFVGRHFWSVNVLVLLTAMWNGVALMMVSQVYPFQMIMFSIYLLIIIVISIIFVIRHSYYASNPYQTSPEQRKIQKVSFVVNIVYGVMLFTAALFVTYGMLIFGGMGWHVLIPVSSIFAWLLFYKFQMTFIQKRPIAAIFVGLVFLFLVAASPFAISGLIRG
ncbi:hypothetical protein GCM10010954_11220 [Halobacillus andaensis]|uniref:Uncharacterized protein n=1 Tax=Halobacillus andaensis TaxID=1176239 RepID=A0A917B0M3_HALAA|nr:permease prefix domain 1-containing protein [Halobacillus andaensis]MBP2003916.1 hypothetical protein [Halobacillus andaensis]GGF14282.1 hypothetical protein GCM10010954_11220 [Halobacillus andaensis]